MSKMIKIIFVLRFLLPMCLDAQTVTWQKWYDYNSKDEAGEDVCQTFDGGYIILGNIYQINNYFTTLTKTDYLGNVEWRKVFDYSITNNDPLSCFTVCQLNDSGFTISGQGRDSAVIIKTDKSGNLIWLKKYLMMKAKEARFYDHYNTFDNGIVAAGYSSSSSSDKLYVVKTDSLGKIQWEREIKPFGKEAINTIIQTQDSMYYFSGYNCVGKMSKNGNLVWFYEIQKIGSSLVELSSNSILLAGSNPMMYLTKIDTTGKVLWQKNYFPGAGCLSMALSQNKNIVLCGFKDTLLNTYTAVTKTDSSGNEIFKKVIISSPSNYFFIPWAINPTKDSGFILTGRTNFPSKFLYKDNIYVIKTDSLFNVPEIVNIKNNNFTISRNFKLFQNYPNPFNPVTTIEYELTTSSFVEIAVYDNNGREICILANSLMSKGNYKIIFNAESYNIASGLLFLKLVVRHSTSKFEDIKKMIFLK